MNWNLMTAAILAGGLGAAPAMAQGAKPNDAQIAHIAYTAGQIDIDAAQLALKKSKNKEVRAFAEDMVRDHKAVNEKALALVKKLNVTPQDNDTSKGLLKQAKDKQAELQKLSGAAFDKAYAANEVAYHKTGQRRAREHAHSVRQQRRAQGSAGHRPETLPGPPAARRARVCGPEVGRRQCGRSPSC